MSNTTTIHSTEANTTLVEEIKTLLPRCMLQERVALAGQFKKLRRSRRSNVKALSRLKDRAVASAALLDTRRRNRPIVTYPDTLPLTAKKDEILQALLANPVVIVAGETGSGKTTQLPKICLEAGRGLEARIACTQPRRVAALSVSRRIAEELGVQWGREVGCKIRFADETAPETCVKMMTDGMLLAEIQNDPQLYEYDTIIIDEAHERSLNIDFLLGYLRLLRSKRPDLKVIITSATIDVESFSRAFDNAPIIEVSGRMYPVETSYRPLADTREDSDDYTYIDAAVDAVDMVVEDMSRGDILLFLPTEKDIHETRRLLEGRLFPQTEILPMFGRLTASDQQRVFHPQGRRRRIVVATNVAETSLTIPGIRYVIDTGLARISRYNPHTQTHRLPIEPIAQSSARQRAGRCGRISHGVCIRLYSEEDLLERPRYTQPEIQRANLAEVILRMLSIRLGDIQTFPFLDPPPPRAIHGGFQLLQELGALDGNRQLTPLGRDMARLPIAPTVARMVLQAQHEDALREVLIIASAISIQDPRVRPLDRQQEADREHRKFLHAESDFLTLLNIWNAYHNMLEGMDRQSRMRKFCRSHYLSYNRMREWRDIHVQLRRTLKELGGFRWNREDAGYDAIHRSILCGLLSNIAQKDQTNYYKGARGRDVMLFPGSGLFQRKPEGKTGKATTSSADPQHTPGWIVAAEMVETSRIFARTTARIQPRWISKLGAHLCRSSYAEPHWDGKSGRVMATETLTLYGLQIRRRLTPYHSFNPTEATKIFIQEALVSDKIESSQAFLAHNRKVRRDLETWQMAMRHGHGVDLDEAVYTFYEERLPHVSSIHDLHRIVREHQKDEASFLFMEASDLAGDRDIVIDREIFPDHILVDNEALPLTYAYSPGQDDDGVTLTMPFKMMHFIQPGMLEWLVPGLLPEKITHLLRGLPKVKRRRFVPIPDTVRAIATELRPTHGSLLASLEAHIQEEYGVRIERSEWRVDAIPDHLKMRIRVQDDGNQTALEGRDLSVLADTLDDRAKTEESHAWIKAATAWERHDLRGWTIGDLPEQVEVTRVGMVPLYGYPGLQQDDDIVSVRLFRTPEEVEQETRRGLLRLYEWALKDDMAWLKRDLRDVRQFQALCVHAGGQQALQEDAFAHLTDFLFVRESLLPLTEKRFETEVEEARDLLVGLTPRFLDLMGTIDDIYRDIRQSPHTYPDMAQDMSRLLPSDFLRHIPYTHLPHLCRYLRAVRLRAERAGMDAVKDRRKVELVTPFQVALEALQRDDPSAGSDRRLLIEDFRWMLEEYCVSVFAQELGTAYPVSEKRLTRRLDEIRRL